MFYSQLLLSKKGPLGTIWIAAHCYKRLKKEQVQQTNITSSVGAFSLLTFSFSLFSLPLFIYRKLLQEEKKCGLFMLGLCICSFSVTPFSPKGICLFAFYSLEKTGYGNIASSFYPLVNPDVCSNHSVVN